MRKRSGSASNALAFFAQARFFEEPSGLLLCNESKSTFVSLVVINGNPKHFLGAILVELMFFVASQ